MDLRPRLEVVLGLPVRHLHRRYHVDIYDMDQLHLQQVSRRRMSYDLVLDRKVDICRMYHLFFPPGTHKGQGAIVHNASSHNVTAAGVRSTEGQEDHR